MAFAGGIMLVAGWAAIIPDRKWLQVIYGLHSCLLLVHCFIMDESPRWLWMQGRQEEAVKIVAKGVKWNGNDVPLDKQYYLSKAKFSSSTMVEDKPVVQAGVSDLFKTPNLRTKTLNVCFCWFANALAYYGKYIHVLVQRFSQIHNYVSVLMTSTYLYIGLSLSSGKLKGNPLLMLAIMGLVEFPSYIALIFVLGK